MKKTMRRTGALAQSAFTLVELLIVVVLLGILSAIALPKYINYSSEARKRALKTAASAVSAAAATNLALRKSGAGAAVTSCAQAGALATLDTGMTVSAISVTLPAATLGTCLINYTGSNAVSGGVTFSAFGA